MTTHYVLTDPCQEYEESTQVLGVFDTMEEAQAMEGRLRVTWAQYADLERGQPSILLTRTSEIVAFQGLDVVGRWHGVRPSEDFVVDDEGGVRYLDYDERIWPETTTWTEASGPVWV